MKNGKEYSGEGRMGATLEVIDAHYLTGTGRCKS
jgi:hypothetical protein